MDRGDGESFALTCGVQSSWEGRGLGGEGRGVQMSRWSRKLLTSVHGGLGAPGARAVSNPVEWNIHIRIHGHGSRFVRSLAFPELHGIPRVET